MHNALQALCDALDANTSAVRAGSKEAKLFSEVWGNWNTASISPVQAGNKSTYISNYIKNLKIDVLPENIIAHVNALTKSIQGLQPTIVPHLFNGNAASALPPYLETLDFVQDTIEYHFGMSLMHDKKSIPRNILNRIERADEAVSAALERSDGFEKKLDAIQSAYDAAEELPATMEALTKANKKIDSVKSESEQNLGRIVAAETESSQLLQKLKSLEVEASKIVENCGAAYRATTSKGLAASFEDSADKLNTSIKWWIAGLIAALILTGAIGYARIEIINEMLLKPDPSWLMIFSKLAIALLSVGPAVWFAWLSTKQIGQRFRMAEDYTFKASVAKAYEGYRREAARLDPKFEAQLFGSALSRVDEAPLRLVEPQSYGSPMHEALQNETVVSTALAAARERIGAIAGPRGAAKGKQSKTDAEPESAG